MSTRSKWVIHRDPRRVELVEVIVDGERIDLGRIVRTPGSDYQYEILTENHEDRQVPLFEKG